MRIDVDPLQISNAQYTEPSMVNMVEISEYYGEKVDMVEVSDDFKQEAAKEVTKDTHQMFPTETDQGFIREVTEDLNKGTVGSFTTNETTEVFIHIGVTEATEGLRVKLQELDITEDVNMGINMVELTQNTAEMEVDEESLQQ